jgi:hypothetical protein
MLVLLLTMAVPAWATDCRGGDIGLPDFQGGWGKAIAIPENCTRVDLSNNQIGDDGAASIAEALMVNTAITGVNLGGNPIGANWVTAINWLASTAGTRSTVCTGAGIERADDVGGFQCECFGGFLGVGPTCSEYSDAMTCDGHGTAQPSGGCECAGGWVGSDCTTPPGVVAGAVLGGLVALALVVGVSIAVARKVAATLARRREERAFGRQNPLEVTTLAGDRYTLLDWGTVRNLHTALATLYPELGGPGTFALRTTGDSVVVGPDYGSPGRRLLLAGKVGCDQLVLTFGSAGITPATAAAGSAFRKTAAAGCVPAKMLSVSEV